MLLRADPAGDAVGLPTITSSSSTSKQSKQTNGDLDESADADESALTLNPTDIAVGAAEDKDAAVAAESVVAADPAGDAVGLPTITSSSSTSKKSKR